MTRYEYKVVPAPDRGQKAKGVKRPEDRFALALAEVMNRLGAEGWDYIRADILPTQERAGLTSKQTVYHNLLIFRRPLSNSPEDRLSPPDVSQIPERPSEEDTQPAEVPVIAEPDATEPSVEAETEAEDTPPHPLVAQ